MYCQHRVDKTVPIEETVGALAELNKSGKVHPIAAWQTEYPLWTRDPGVTDTLAARRKNGVALLPVHRQAVVFSRVPSPNPKTCQKATVAGARHSVQKKLPAI